MQVTPPIQEQAAATQPTLGLAGQRVHAWMRNGGVLAVVLALATAFFVVRGPVRALEGSKDLAVGYTAAHALVAGLDPYDVAVQEQILEATGGAEVGGFGGFFRNLYFPSTLPAFLPLAWVDWQAARVLWLLGGVVAAGLMVYHLGRAAGFGMRSAEAAWLAAGVLLLFPVHTTLSTGQVSLIVGALLAVAIHKAVVGCARCQGISLGLAISIKPQLALPFLAYWLWRRQWKASAIAVVTVLVMTLVGLALLNRTGAGWYASWQGNLASTFAPGSANDFAGESLLRTSLLNLQYPLAVLLESRLLVHGITFALVGLAAVATLIALPHRGGRERELHALALVAVLTLLVYYHRSYDAVILLVPLAWGIKTLVQRGPQFAPMAVLGLVATFIVPWQSLLKVAQTADLLPNALVDTSAWKAGPLAIHVWTLLAIAALLLRDAFNTRPALAVAPAVS